MSMCDHEEEQLLEQEALEAIFAHDFTVVGVDSPNTKRTWKVHLVPYPDESDTNHVALDLNVELPTDYPDTKPDIQIKLLQGLANEQIQDIQDVIDQEVEVNQGMPCLFAVCEGVKNWLLENNEEYDGSMYAQMMRKQQENKKETQEYESAYERNGPSQTEIEEAAVHKRRAEGTPCTAENFHAWKIRFDAEMEEKRRLEDEENQKNEKKSKDVDYDSRKSGFEIFGEKSGVLDLEAMEVAAELEGKATLDVDNVDEELFDEDESLDDLDFDSDDDDDDDDDDDEEPNI